MWKVCENRFFFMNWLPKKLSGVKLSLSSKHSDIFLLSPNIIQEQQRRVRGREIEEREDRLIENRNEIFRPHFPDWRRSLTSIIANKSWWIGRSKLIFAARETSSDAAAALVHYIYVKVSKSEIWKSIFIQEAYSAYMKNHWEIKCHKLSLSVLIVWPDTERVPLVFKTYVQISDIDAFYNIPSWCRISDGEKKRVL